MKKPHDLSLTSIHEGHQINDIAMFGYIMYAYNSQPVLEWLGY